MERRILGKTGMEVSILGFGGAEIGFEGASRDTVEKVLMAALDEGLNVIDTAECYVNSEELIGHTASDRRGEFFLFTKCGHGADHTVPAWSSSEIEASIDRSLKLLKTDYVDLVQLHSCQRSVLEKGECIEALKKAKAAGKTRFIGYSGDSVDAVYAVETGEFDVLQTSVNIADQEVIDLVLPKAAARNMGVIAKRPIANAAWRYKTKPENPYHVDYWMRLQELKYDFIDGDAKLSAETALKFTLSIKDVHTAIVGTTKPGRWAENSKMLASGLMSGAAFDRIRDRWHKIAKGDWVGQV